jgi:DNA-binding response OmpR family regulator
VNAQLKPQFDAFSKNCEATILTLLAERHGQVVLREELEAAVYGADAMNFPESNCLQVFIGRIRRRKLHSWEYIETVRGQGYVYTYNRGSL